MPFDRATIPLETFKLNHSQDEIDTLRTLLRLSTLPKASYENASIHNHKYGPSLEWLTSMKAAWEEFDFGAKQQEINEYPQYTATIPHVELTSGERTGKHFKVHFVGIENADKDAVPVLMMHGWPGCFVEMLPLIPYLLTHGSPPMTLIIPSLIGTAYSSSPPVEENFTADKCARVMHDLMTGLGYDKYVVQGGDIGSYLGRFLSIRYKECIATHFNFCPQVKPPSIFAQLASTLTLTDSEQAGLERTKWFVQTGHAYAEKHETRPATIGAAISSSPLALLAWLGEPFLHWTDKTPSVDHMLTWLTIYWLTNSFPTSIYFYRDESMRLDMTVDPGQLAENPGSVLPGSYLSKPMGFSRFPKELIVPPKAWVEQTGNVVFYREHGVGGHFAATEQPELLARDFVDFLALAWRSPTTGAVQGQKTSAL